MWKLRPICTSLIFDSYTSAVPYLGSFISFHGTAAADELVTTYWFHVTLIQFGPLEWDVSLIEKLA